MVGFRVGRQMSRSFGLLVRSNILSYPTKVPTSVGITGNFNAPCRGTGVLFGSLRAHNMTTAPCCRYLCCHVEHTAPDAQMMMMMMMLGDRVGKFFYGSSKKFGVFG